MGRTVLSSVLVGPARRLITAWCISRHASAPPTTHTTLTSRGGAASISCISVYHVTPHTSHRQQRTRHSLLLLPMPASPHRTAAFERSSAGTLNAASGSCGAKQRAQPPNKRRPKRRPSRSTRAPSPWSSWRPNEASFGLGCPGEPSGACRGLLPSCHGRAVVEDLLGRPRTGRAGRHGTESSRVESRRARRRGAVQVVPTSLIQLLTPAVGAVHQPR